MLIGFPWDHPRTAFVKSHVRKIKTGSRTKTVAVKGYIRKSSTKKKIK